MLCRKGKWRFGFLVCQVFRMASVVQRTATTGWPWPVQTSPSSRLFPTGLWPQLSCCHTSHQLLLERTVRTCMHFLISGGMKVHMTVSEDDLGCPRQFFWYVQIDIYSQLACAWVANKCSSLWQPGPLVTSAYRHLSVCLRAHLYVPGPRNGPVSVLQMCLVMSNAARLPNSNLLCIAGF